MTTGRGNLTSRLPLIISLSYIGITQIALDSNKKELTSCNHCRPKKYPFEVGLPVAMLKAIFFRPATQPGQALDWGLFCAMLFLAEYWLANTNLYIYVYNQRKFRSSNFRLYWKLPVGLAASMFDRRDVLQRRCETWEILAGRNCAKRCVFP